MYITSMIVSMNIRFGLIRTAHAHDVVITLGINLDNSSPHASVRLSLTVDTLL